MSAAGQRGLTLPELLIALLIFAMISGAAVYALRLSVEGREQLETADRDIREMQIARRIIKEDLALTTDRIVRDEFGNPLPASFIGGSGLAFRKLVEGEQSLVIFVRRGWINPDDRAPRSTLQAVEYLVKDGNLVRRVRPYLDDARDQPRFDRVLIGGVSNVSIVFATGNETSSGAEFIDLWPTPRSDGAITPPAIRLMLTTKRFGEIEQLFWLGKS